MASYHGNPLVIGEAPKRRGGWPVRTPKPGERVAMSFRVTPEFKARIEAAAQRKGRSLMHEVEHLLELGMIFETLLGWGQRPPVKDLAAAAVARVVERLQDSGVAQPVKAPKPARTITPKPVKRYRPSPLDSQVLARIIAKPNITIDELRVGMRRIAPNILGTCVARLLKDGYISGTAKAGRLFATDDGVAALARKPMPLG